MKIVIAPDSYKESLSALEVATAIEQGFREIWPDADYLKLPLADGGEGTVEAMVEATAGRIVHVEVTGPLGHRVNAFYGLSGDARSAFIEMAAASGLEQVPPAQRDPLKTTSWGTGELIRHALDAGVSISLLVSAVAPPTMAARGWCRRWGPGYGMRRAMILCKAALGWKHSPALISAAG